MPVRAGQGSTTSLTSCLELPLPVSRQAAATLLPGLLTLAKAAQLGAVLPAECYKQGGLCHWAKSWARGCLPGRVEQECDMRCCMPCGPAGRAAPQEPLTLLHCQAANNPSLLHDPTTLTPPSYRPAQTRCPAALLWRLPLPHPNPLQQPASIHPLSPNHPGPPAAKLASQPAQQLLPTQQPEVLLLQASPPLVCLQLRSLLSCLQT
ncbi:hypothetical protein V8C86DRAFT_2738907 [Haematococcus lacustris]